MKRLLITGGAGFIGSKFIRYWLESHPEDYLVNFDALRHSGNLENLSGLEECPNYRFIKGDICDRDEVEEAMKDGIDVMVNFASSISPLFLPANFTSVNFAKTNVLGCAFYILHCYKRIGASNPSKFLI